MRLLPVSRVIPDDVSFQQMLEYARQILPDHSEQPGSDELAESNGVEILMSSEIQNALIHSPRSGPERQERDGLRIGFRRAPRGLMGTLTYGAEASGEIRIARMAKHLQTLLGAVAVMPAERISRLNILGNPGKTRDP